MTPATVPAWVVGAGGLLGRSVHGELERRGGPVRVSSVPWHDADAARAVLVRDARQFADDVRGGPWQLAWCAGAGVNGTTDEQFAVENSLLQATLDALAVAEPGHGALLYASSAGGVYAGGDAAPFDEHSPVAALSAYGRAKLAAEDVVGEFTRRTGVPSVLARFANLYGPGQNLAKPQGLVSHLCRGYLLRRPVSIYVSMDTLRDYLYVTDAAEMTADALARALRHPDADGPVVKVFASGRTVTIGALLATCRAVFHTRPEVVLATSPLAAGQRRDLRLRSRVWPELDDRSHRTLVDGVAATLASIRGQLTT
ncbi:NAD-dependent epimerase/dehydratase family protein [Rhodococcus rhodnii]|uniref:NAD-dependent epimerase/dehydratase domain-containing protein n=2 Tax=Rhodococcus rhodnii TaxID=38312 RepID=R7WNS0_9NOCA|nr:NAD-dependent epimerase/dehydratase family protein [Rhodococcus rhodnii]EOM76952.1 hypothetical protein Rrhod_1679 [Rhodococcus rhodnii LMG 5362]TXG89473.1 NAD-dependent epimerase/dehydratase family protein [Rhodococcus rhodnii]